MHRFWTLERRPIQNWHLAIISIFVDYENRVLLVYHEMIRRIVLVVWSQMTKINRTFERSHDASRVDIWAGPFSCLPSCKVSEFGQQSPDAKTAVTLSVICASNFMRRARTRDRSGAATSPEAECGAIFIEGGPRLSKVITIFSLTASAIIAVTSTARNLSKSMKWKQKCHVCPKTYSSDSHKKTRTF